MADRFGGGRQPPQPMIHRGLHQQFDSQKQAIRKQNNAATLDDDDDDDDDVVVDEEEDEDELDELGCDLAEKKLAQSGLQHGQDIIAEDEHFRLLVKTSALTTQSSLEAGPDNSNCLVSEMLANMAARFKNFEEILADLRLQLGEMRSRDGELLRRMALLNEHISEMHLNDLALAHPSGLNASGLHGAHSNLAAATSAVSSSYAGAEAYGDLHMTDYGGAEAHLASHLKAATSNKSRGPGKMAYGHK